MFEVPLFHHERSLLSRAATKQWLVNTGNCTMKQCKSKWGKHLVWSHKEAVDVKRVNRWRRCTLHWVNHALTRWSLIWRLHRNLEHRTYVWQRWAASFILCLSFTSHFHKHTHSHTDKDFRPSYGQKCLLRLCIFPHCGINTGFLLLLSGHVARGPAVWHTAELMLLHNTGTTIWRVRQGQGCNKRLIVGQFPVAPLALMMPSVIAILPLIVFVLCLSPHQHLFMVRLFVERGGLQVHTLSSHK